MWLDYLGKIYKKIIKNIYFYFLVIHDLVFKKIIS